MRSGLVVMMVALSASVAGQPATTAARQPARFNVPVDYFTLPNGLKVVVSEDHSAPAEMRCEFTRNRSTGPLQRP